MMRGAGLARTWKAERRLVTCLAPSWQVSEHGGATYIITLLEWPTARPFDNNIVGHDGNPPLSLFACGTSSIFEVRSPHPRHVMRRERDRDRARDRERDSSATSEPVQPSCV
jgi:hypothetical protein